MGDKNIMLFAPAGMLYADGAPLLAVGAELTHDKRSGKLNVRLRLKNISDTVIHAAAITVRGLDINGEPAFGDVVRLIDGLNVSRDGEFGQDNIFELVGSNVYSFSILVGEVMFADGSIWTGGSSRWTELTPRQTLEEGLGDVELAAQFRIRYGANCKYMPSAQRGIWLCTCGGINRADETNCHLCRRTWAALTAVNLGSLKSECAERLKLERQRQEADLGETAARRKKLLRRTMLIAPIALLLALVIAVLPGYVAGRKAYSSAAAMLSAGMYDDAAAAFTELGAYGDSREQAEKNVPYQKGIYILDCADSGLTSGLALLDLKRSQFDDDEHMRIALYEGAANIFNSLDGYKDSQAKSAYAEDAAAQIVEQLNSAAYDAAAALLKEQKYRQARDAFAALGDYRDCEAMAQECIYRKAAALLEFAETYNVRDISVRMSGVASEPDEYHMTMAAMGRLGETGAAVLRRICSGDGMELSVADVIADSAMLPICDCIYNIFDSLHEYKDSAELAERAKQAGDFTRPFFELCAKGELVAAADWLRKYDGAFDGRDGWLAALGVYLPLCRAWELYRGDSTLIPLTVGADGVCGSFVSCVVFNGADAALRISFGDEGKIVELAAEPGNTRFSFSPDEYTHYFVTLNTLGHLIYLKYNADGTLASSCEYS